MTFISLPFLIFLGIFFTLYWVLAERRRQNVMLTLASYLFYGWWDYRFCALILTSSLVDYGVGRALERTEAPRARRAWVTVSVLSNLSLLGFFKYWGFFSESFQALAALLGWQVDPFTLRVVLPIGLSFYTFQTMGYSIDVYRRDVTPRRNLLDYLAFVSFFPQLVAGPIERAGRLLPQFEAPRRFDAEQAFAGCRQMLWGFFKKMVIADNIAPIVDRAYGAPEEFGGPVLALAAICFMFQVYCDFSGYADIGIGTAKLFGIDLMRNFNYPFFAQSVPEHWQRWHISLSTWLRDYVYIPLGGNRSWTRRNLVITMGLSGLWHGASWAFVVWGLYHGLLMVVVRELSRLRVFAAWSRRREAWAQAVNMLVTFLLIAVGHIFFRAESFGDGMIILGRIAGGLFAAGGLSELAAWLGDKDVAVSIAFSVGFVLAEWGGRHVEQPLERPPRNAALRWALYTAIIWLCLSYGTHSTGAFIYFQF